MKKHLITENRVVGKVENPLPIIVIDNPLQKNNKQGNDSMQLNS